MKQFSLIFALLIVSLFSVRAQVTEDMYTVKDGAIIVEKVIPFSVSKDDASAAVKSFFLTKLNDSNETMKNSSDDYYVVKILTPELASHSLGNWYTQGELTIDVRFKENRMKATVSCSNIINANRQGTRRNYNPTIAAPLSKHDAWKTNIVQKAAEETFNNLVMYMALIVEELNTSVQNAEADDDW